VAKALRGDTWLADLGMAAKVRPVLVLSIPHGDEDYALISVVPHTTVPRGAHFEIKVNVRSLRESAFNVQGMLAVPEAKFIRKIDSLDSAQLQQVEAVVKRWLGLT
jgi:mRNA interferase MazF